MHVSDVLRGGSGTDRNLAGDNSALLFQLTKRAVQLQLLCRRWEEDTKPIPSTGQVLWVPADVLSGFPLQRIVDNVIQELHFADVDEDMEDVFTNITIDNNSDNPSSDNGSDDDTNDEDSDGEDMDASIARGGDIGDVDD